MFEEVNKLIIGPKTIEKAVAAVTALIEENAEEINAAANLLKTVPVRLSINFLKKGDYVKMKTGISYPIAKVSYHSSQDISEKQEDLPLKFKNKPKGKLSLIQKTSGEK